MQVALNSWAARMRRSKRRLQQGEGSSPPQRATEREVECPRMQAPRHTRQQQALSYQVGYGATVCRCALLPGEFGGIPA